MRLGGLLLLGWLYALSACADERAQHLHEIRTRSALLCSSALLYFNPAHKEPDSRALAASYDSLNLLATRTVQLGQPEPMATHLRDMQRLFKDLERLPRQEAASYPLLLQQMLRLQRAMAAWASSQLAQDELAVGSLTQALRQQSLDMAYLLLDYQARSYPLAGEAVAVLTASERQALDRRLNQGFVSLRATEAALAEPLDAARKGYRFVRTRILVSTTGQPSGGVEFYLARSVVDMDELAAQTDSPGAL
ncbi:hypothetical protein ACIGFL_07145 [Pseudomonas sp. NPDC077649]|uniref:hypothetical protein n=1 Tax=Pseudomonas sp. NPDC077649 TaxID=3364423 RepID=UPI0037C68231